MATKEIIVDEDFIESMQQYRIPNKELGRIGASADNFAVFLWRGPRIVRQVF